MKFKSIIPVIVILALLMLTSGCSEPSLRVISVESFDSGSESSEESSAVNIGTIPKSTSSRTASTALSAASPESTPPVSSESTCSEEYTASISDVPEPEPEYSYKSYALYCVDDKKLLCTENIDGRVAPASLTKLLTASVALYYIDANEVIEVGSEQNLVHPGSSLCFILEGHRLKLYDLITGMLMASGNDAAYTAAVCTARRVVGDSTMTDAEAADYFCGLMNDFAQKLGMSDSRFTTPDGWDDAEQYTTVRDLTLLAEYALSVPEIREIVSNYQKYVVFDSGENITWTNSNKLLNPESGFYCENAIGMKTGTTPLAGSCLIAAFAKGGKTYISVVTGCASDRDRYGVTIAKWMKNLA